MLTLKDRIEKIITKSKDKVFLRNEFGGMGGYRQVSRALQELVQDGLLIKSGYGIYVKTEPSIFDGLPIPSATLMEIGMSVMKKIGVKADVGQSAQQYREGKTTQIPVRAIVNIGKSRIVRRIYVGKNSVRYERC